MDAPKLAEVVTLYESNAARHPIQTLRVIADDAEAGKLGDIRSIVVVMELSDGPVEVFGLGDQGLLRAIGALHLGIAKLASMRSRDE